MKLWLAVLVLLLFSCAAKPRLTPKEQMRQELRTIIENAHQDFQRWYSLYMCGEITADEFYRLVQGRNEVLEMWRLGQ